jgi:hypothetical protein
MLTRAGLGFACWALLAAVLLGQARAQDEWPAP